MSLINQVQGSYSDLHQQQKIGNRSVTILEKERAVEVFRGTANQGGQSAKVEISMTTFKHQGDTIIGVGIIPQAVSGNGDAPVSLFKAIQHG